MTTLTDVYQNNEKWLRLITLIDYAGLKLCKDVLHKAEGLPDDGAQLFCRLKDYKNKMQYRSQKEILCPPNGITDESKFDITLYTKLIDVMFKPKYDLLIKDLRDNRNDLCHMANKDISESEFEKRWKHLCEMLKRHDFTEKVEDLENSNLLAVTKLGKILDFIISQIKGSVQVLLFLQIPCPAKRHVWQN